MNILNKIDPLPNQPGFVLVTAKCACCEKEVEIKAPQAGVFLYLAGESVHKCFPHMSAEEREMFISELCPDCFPKDFEEEEENHDDLCLN